VSDSELGCRPRACWGASVVPLGVLGTFAPPGVFGCNGWAPPTELWLPLREVSVLQSQHWIITCLRRQLEQTGLISSHYNWIQQTFKLKTSVGGRLTLTFRSRQSLHPERDFLSRGPRCRTEASANSMENSAWLPTQTAEIKKRWRTCEVAKSRNVELVSRRRGSTASQSYGQANFRESLTLIG
jgi:hypothetical protein